MYQKIHGSKYNQICRPIFYFKKKTEELRRQHKYIQFLRYFVVNYVGICACTACSRTVIQDRNDKTKGHYILFKNIFSVITFLAVTFFQCLKIFINWRFTETKKQKLIYLFLQTLINFELFVVDRNAVFLPLTFCYSNTSS